MRFFENLGEGVFITARYVFDWVVTAALALITSLILCCDFAAVISICRSTGLITRFCL